MNPTIVEMDVFNYENSLLFGNSIKCFTIVFQERTTSVKIKLTNAALMDQTFVSNTLPGRRFNAPGSAYFVHVSFM